MRASVKETGIPNTVFTQLRQISLKGGKHVSCYSLINSPSTIPRKCVLQKRPMTTTEALQVVAVGDFADTLAADTGQQKFPAAHKGKQ